MKRWLLYVIEFSNGKRYFGITCQSLSRRWCAHLDISRTGIKRPVCAALRKHSASMRALVVGPKEYIHSLEIAAISAFKSTDRQFGYNVGAGGELNPMFGNRHSIEARSKISAASKNRIRTAASNAKTSASLKGRPISEERRRAISAATKAAMAAPEVRAKISAAKVGVTPAASRHPRVLSAEHRANIGKGGRGLKRSPETCERIRLAKLATWAAKREQGET